MLKAQVGIRIEKELLEKIKEVGEITEKSVSELIRETLEGRFLEATIQELVRKTLEKDYSETVNMMKLLKKFDERVSKNYVKSIKS